MSIFFETRYNIYEIQNGLHLLVVSCSDESEINESIAQIQEQLEGKTEVDRIFIIKKEYQARNGFIISGTPKKRM